jgi:hypothetical protein
MATDSRLIPSKQQGLLNPLFGDLSLLSGLLSGLLNGLHSAEGMFHLGNTLGFQVNQVLCAAKEVGAINIEDTGGGGGGAAPKFPSYN